jgi:GNAT superfamily N-acetyltransferase
VKVVRVSSETLVELIREMFEANSGFLHNLNVIFDCFAAGRMYGLELPQTYEMFEYDGPDEPIFIQDTYNIPAFCCLDSNSSVEILWVHPRARRFGFGSAFLKQLNIKSANSVLFDSQEFWNRHPTVTCSNVLPAQTYHECNHGDFLPQHQDKCFLCAHRLRKKRKKTRPAS